MSAENKAQNEGKVVDTEKVPFWKKPFFRITVAALGGVAAIATTAIVSYKSGKNAGLKQNALPAVADDINVLPEDLAQTEYIGE